MMNIYLRYFDSEVLVDTVERALDFLRSIPQINVDDFLENELRSFVEGSAVYPKRFKVSGRAYFIVIKTTANTMAEFKAAGVAARDAAAEKAEAREHLDAYTEVRPGWYEATMKFKRVLAMPETQKYQYCDTTFRAKVYAESGVQCYEKMVAHLKSRDDIDKRSQYPSIKGRNFECHLLEQDNQ